MNYEDIIIGLIALGCIFYLYKKLFRKKAIVAAEAVVIVTQRKIEISLYFFVFQKFFL